MFTAHEKKNVHQSPTDLSEYDNVYNFLQEAGNTTLGNMFSIPRKLPKP